MPEPSLNAGIDALPLWDSAALTRAVGDNPAIHKRLLQKYVSTAGASVEELAASVTQGDWLAAAELAHKLKSASRSVGAMHLGALCELLEHAGRAANGPACVELLPLVSQGFEKIHGLIQAQR